MYEPIAGVTRKGQERAFEPRAQPCGDRRASILPECRKPRLGIRDAGDQCKMRVERAQWQEGGASRPRLGERREFLSPTGDRDDGQVDREALGVRVKKKSCPHGKPVAAVARHDGCDEESG
jgi:hypothetical protein